MGVKLGPSAREAIEPTGDLVMRAATADGFKGKNGSILEIVAPSDLDVIAPDRHRRQARGETSSPRIS